MFAIAPLFPTYGSGDVKIVDLQNDYWRSLDKAPFRREYFVIFLRDSILKEIYE